MPYDREIFSEVSRQFAKKRQRAKIEYKNHLQEVYEKVPRIRQIDAELSKTSVEVARSILGGGEDIAATMEGLRQRNLSLQSERESLLVSHGFPRGYLKTQYECEKCEDEGYVDGKMCHCFKSALKKETFDRINAHSHLSLASFDTFRLDYYPDQKDAGANITQRDRMKEILGYCQCYARDVSHRSPSIFMTGSTGLGKTHLSLAIANSAISRGMNVVYNSWQNLLNDIEREKFGYGESSPADTMESLISCDLLILDDVGAEFINNFDLSALYNVINSRMNAKKPTIISSNLSPKEIKEKYGERVMSRLTGEYIMLRFAGNDIRQILNSESV